MMMKSAIALGLLVSASAAQASEWWFVSASSRGAYQLLTFADREGITGGSANRRVWTHSFTNDPARASSESKSLSEYDCQGGRSRTIQILDLTPGRMAVVKGDEKWTFLPPDSNGEAMRKFVCSDVPTGEGYFKLDDLVPPKALAKSMFNDPTP